MKKLSFIFMMLATILFLGGCKSVGEIKFLLGEETTMMVGDEKKLEIENESNLKGLKYSSSDEDIVFIDDNGVASANEVGNAIIKASYKKQEAKIKIRVIERFTDQELRLSVDDTKIGLSDSLKLKLVIIKDNKEEVVTDNINYKIASGKAKIEGNTLYPLALGYIEVEAEALGLKSNKITINVLKDDTIELRSNKYFLRAGDTTTLSSRFIPAKDDINYSYTVVDGSENVKIDGNTITAIKPGEARIKASALGIDSNEITITVVPFTNTTPKNISIRLDSLNMNRGDMQVISYEVVDEFSRLDITFSIVEGKNNAEIIGDRVYAINDGAFSIVGIIDGVISNKLIINSKDLTSDPYIDIDKEDFYNNYTKALSYTDAYYRTKHSLMSGSIAPQDQAPSLASNQPKENGKLIRNTDAFYSKDGNTYYIPDENGNIVNAVYKNGGYVTLEEVAAHVFAFGSIPANHSEGKLVSPSFSPWGIYLRCNHTPFSGNINKFPYEPLLPDISGAGGNTNYYEMDLGTTGTDCDPKYPAEPYNDGEYITRGAARIVYTRSNSEGLIEDINDRHVFYTYNHYNDFQEYLNYQGGWGEMFGNITGGGVLSSKKPGLYHPTPYVEVIYKSFTKAI